MSNISIGITAMELFAYNPFRILGIAVNTPQNEVKNTYDKLIALADSGEITDYKTAFDFESLPPFSRSAQTLKTAYAKLASNGYRCFAYSDSQFSTSLNIDDILLNIRDITCYDCFLRCYMWLIINDREMQEHDLWIRLAKYIDKMIMSSPEEWSKYFDNRFPEDMIDDKMLIYKSFYSTFCEIILLPLKEMVRGSMKCRSATEILQCAKIDINEEFEDIDIPQANKPKPGEPEPKLKLALKYGDEYFDIKTGKMMSYSTDTTAAESNSFSDSGNAPLAAADIINDRSDSISESEISVLQSAEQADEEFINNTVKEPEFIPEPESKSAPMQKTEQDRQPKPAEEQPKSIHKFEYRRTEKKNEAAATDQSERKAPPKPTQPVAPKPEPLKLDETGAQTTAPKRSFRTMMAQQTGSSLENNVSGKETPKEQTQSTAFSSGNPFFSAAKKNEESSVKSAKRTQKDYTKIVVETEKKAAEEAASVSLTEDMEDEENLYTSALIEMLRSNRSFMKEADTRHALSDGAKELQVTVGSQAAMDAINMDKYNDKLLASPYGSPARKMTREEKYRNVKIDDMIGKPNYQATAIEDFKKKKAAEKQSRRSIITLSCVLGLILIIWVVLWYLGIL